MDVLLMDLRKTAPSPCRNHVLVQDAPNIMKRRRLQVRSVAQEELVDAILDEIVRWRSGCLSGLLGLLRGQGIDAAGP